MILLLINLILLIVGCFMETVAAITILVPVLLPVAVQLGVDPVHFGVIMVLNLMMGLLTPPVGMVLYVSPGREDSVRALRRRHRAVPDPAGAGAAADHLRSGDHHVAAHADLPLT